MASELNDETLNIERLEAALGKRPFRFLKTVSSTNDVARVWAAEGAPHGAVVVTEMQEAGRGRFGRRWQAPSGTALLFSVVLRPQKATPQATRYTMAAAVAVRNTLLELPNLDSACVKLKWPNDVHIHDRKVAGILIEPLWNGAVLEAIIVGIGINVRVPFDLPELRQSATNLEAHSIPNIDRARLLGVLLDQLESWAARAEGLSLFQAWRAALSTLGRHVQATDVGLGTRAISGQAVDVDEDGALLVRGEDGKVHRVFAGEVTLSKPKFE